VRKIQRHLIVCEDSKSGADYLRSFEVAADFVEVVIEGGAGNTDGVVEKALALRKTAIEAKQPYARVWCVFDRDSFPAKNFNRAFGLASGKETSDVAIIWANECFEIWYLLHFELRTTGIGRKALRKEISKPNRLGRKYGKGDATVFDLLKDKTHAAIKNSKMLLAQYGNALHPERDNPSTNVHELVIVLQQLKQLNCWTMAGCTSIPASTA
jgi:hypothetical protein